MSTVMTIWFFLISLQGKISYYIIHRIKKKILSRPIPPPTPQTHKDKQKQTRIHENIKELNTLIEKDLNDSCIVTIAISTFHKMKTKLVLLWYVFPELDYMFIFQCHWIYSHYKSI